MSQDIIMIVTIAGVFMHMILAYLSKKQTDQTLKFDYTYLIAAFAAVFGSVTILQSLPTEMTALNILIALGMGFSINAGIAFINSNAPIINKIEIKR